MPSLETDIRDLKVRPNEKDKKGMLGLSLSTANSSRNGGGYYGTDASRRSFKLAENAFVVPWINGNYSWYRVHNSHFAGDIRLSRRRNVKAQAGWLFRGSQQPSDASVERSESANEDILMFFFQLDLATRMQYALNLDQYDIAKQLRDKLTEVEAEMIKQQEARTGSSSKSEAQDKAISIIRMRADLQKAVESEDYAMASKLRDKISKLQAESLAVSTKAWAYEKAEYSFRLGQKVQHKVFGYHGVICGMDPFCCESSSWVEAAKIDKLDRGPNQPFYQVLVNMYNDPDLLVTYVPEDNLTTPEKRNTDRYDHPYLSFLFYGMDTAGDFIPIKQLREKYNRPRHEAPMDPDEDGQG